MTLLSFFQFFMYSPLLLADIEGANMPCANAKAHMDNHCHKMLEEIFSHVTIKRKHYELPDIDLVIKSVGTKLPKCENEALRLTVLSICNHMSFKKYKK